MSSSLRCKLSTMNRSLTCETSNSRISIGMQVMSCLHIAIANAYLNLPATVLKVGDIQHSCREIQIRISNTFCIHLNLISSTGASLLAQY